jgi:hypothetical protein
VKIKFIVISAVLLLAFTGCSDSTNSNNKVTVKWNFNLPEDLFPVNIRIYDEADFKGSDFSGISGSEDFYETEFLQQILAGNLKFSQTLAAGSTGGNGELNKLSGKYGYALFLLGNSSFMLQKVENAPDWNFSIKLYNAISGLRDSLNISDGEIVYIDDNLSVLKSAVIGKNSALIIAPGKKINIYNNCEINGGNTVISGIFPQTSANRFLYVKSEGNTQIENLILGGGINSFQIENAAGAAVIKNTAVVNNDIGIYVNSNSLSLSDIYAAANNEGVFLINATSGYLDNGWFVKNNTGLHCENLKADIGNSMFSENTVGLLPVFGNNTVHGSTFDNNEFGISVNTDSIRIYENLFKENKNGIEFNRNYVQQSYIFSKAAPRNNNFIDNYYHANVFGVNSASGPLENGTGIHEDQDFSGNYWVDQSEYQIKTKIMDGEDSGITDLLITVSPFLNAEVASAGKK